MLTNKETRELTMQIITNRGFEIVLAEKNKVVFEGFGAHGSVYFVANKEHPCLKFCFNKDYTVMFEDDDWEHERMRFLMANHFSKIHEGIFSINYEPPGTYSCTSAIHKNIFDEAIYEEWLKYMLCISIEGYEVLNCEKFYLATATRFLMESIFEQNIASLGAWSNPGRWTQQYA